MFFARKPQAFNAVSVVQTTTKQIISTGNRCWFVSAIHREKYKNKKKRETKFLSDGHGSFYCGKKVFRCIGNECLFFRHGLHEGCNIEQKGEEKAGDGASPTATKGKKTGVERQARERRSEWIMKDGRRQRMRKSG